MVQRGGSLTDTETFSYDEDGNVLTASNNNGATVLTYSYDALNRVATYEDPFGITLTYTYDGDDNPIEVDDSLGGETISTYNALNLLTSREVAGVGTTTPEVDLTYTPTGEVATMTREGAAGGLRSGRRLTVMMTWTR